LIPATLSIEDTDPVRLGTADPKAITDLDRGCSAAQHTKESARHIDLGLHAVGVEARDVEGGKQVAFGLRSGDLLIFELFRRRRM